MADAQPSPQLGKYRLIIELAQGGMGRVFLAVAQGPAGFSKLAVIKELKPTLLEEPGFLDMFLAEARLSARLSHPNVVQTNEASVDGGRAWLAMEYLDGQSLVRVRARLTKLGKLPLPMHLRIIAEACHGLHYAHELRDFDGTPLGVVHRDVSPHNIFITYDGQVKIVDFGIAKVIASSHETTAGVMKGKVPYMAPEQVLGFPTDRRLDVFAIGIVIWEAVANRRMWAGMRIETIIAQLMNGDIPAITEVVPSTPPRLAALIDRATAAEPEHRFPTIEMLRLELEACIVEMGGADPGALREVGRAMSEAFAAERAHVSEAVQLQLRSLRDAVPAQNVTVVALQAPMMTGSYGALHPGTGSGSGAPHRYPSGATPMPMPMPGAMPLPTVAMPHEPGGGTGRTAASLAVANSHMPPSRGPSRAGIIAAAAVSVVFVVGAATIGIRVVRGGSSPSAPDAAPVVTTDEPSATAPSATATAIEIPSGAPTDSAQPTTHVAHAAADAGTSPAPTKTTFGGQKTSTPPRPHPTGEGRKQPANDDPDLGY